MKDKTVLSIAARMADVNGCAVEQLPWEQGGGFYRVWRLTGWRGSFILKESCPTELEIYGAVSGRSFALPAFFGSTVWRGKPWILIEDIRGESLSVCTRAALTAALDSMIELQGLYWTLPVHLGESVQSSLPLRTARRRYIPGIMLRRAFDLSIEAYRSAAVTLCHDDMLPQNVFYDGWRAVLLDWEYAGMLPWPVMLARLLAHTSSNGATPFYMSAEDKSFALDYYFEHFIAARGVSRADYDRTMKLFIFYELTEWIYVYRKGHRARDGLYRYYFAAARDEAKEILFG